MYVLDANIFIDAKNRHYGFDIVPGFWDWLIEQNAAGILCSISEVKAELEEKQDELTAWARNNAGLFLPVDQAVQPSLQQLANWANSGWFKPAAVSKFLDDADYPLVAYAHAHSHTVVTHEKSSPDATARILIPDACTALGVPSIDPFTMLRAEGAKFVKA